MTNSWGSLTAISNSCDHTPTSRCLLSEISEKNYRLFTVISYIYHILEGSLTAKIQIHVIRCDDVLWRDAICYAVMWCDILSV